MMTTKDEVYFVYSIQQVEEDKSINSRVGRKFIPGYVSVGNDRMKYSKILLKTDLEKMTSRYPDVNIVAQGVLGNFKYTKIDDGFVR